MKLNASRKSLVPPSSREQARGLAVVQNPTHVLGQELKIETWPVERLVPYARNARLHSETQVAQVAASIAEFGFNNPVLISPQGDPIAGHARVLAARKLSYDVVLAVFLSAMFPRQD